MDESTPTTAVRASFFNLHVSRKGEFEDDERASKRQRVGSSAAAGLKMNPDSSVVPNPVPVVRKPAARATATATFTASTRRSTRLQQGIVKPQIKVRQPRSQDCILRLILSGAVPTLIGGKPKRPTPLTILRTYN